MKIPNWENTIIDDLGDLLRGVSYKKHEAEKIPAEGLKPILRANNINGELNHDNLVFVPVNRLKDEQYIKAGDIIFAMSSGSKGLVGKSAQAKSNYDGSYGAFCGLYRPANYINKKFLGFFFQAPFYRGHIRSIAKGTNINNLKREHILDLDICLPPLYEQNQIVSIVEQLLSDLDNAIDNLKKAKGQLKIYRQSVLKYAFEGNWKRIELREISESCGGFAFKSGSFQDTGKYQVIRIGNVRPGIVRFNVSPVFLENAEKKVLDKYLLKPGYVVISLTGTRKKRDYGYTTIIQKENLLLNQRLAYLRMNKECLPKFFLYYSWTELFKNSFFASETGNVGQGNVGMKAIQATKIPLPSLAEQQKIIQDIESRFSVCDKMEETIENSLNQAEALRQSILKQAFEGKLTEEWRKNNPELVSRENSAKALLEKIKTERESLKNTKKRKK